jgi:hypothetical protein
MSLWRPQLPRISTVNQNNVFGEQNIYIYTHAHWMCAPALWKCHQNWTKLFVAAGGAAVLVIPAHLQKRDVLYKAQSLLLQKLI